MGIAKGSMVKVDSFYNASFYDCGRYRGKEGLTLTESQDGSTLVSFPGFTHNRWIRTEALTLMKHEAPREVLAWFGL